jgi:hypothetical protein
MLLAKAALRARLFVAPQFVKTAFGPATVEGLNLAGSMVHTDDPRLELR